MRITEVGLRDGNHRTISASPARRGAGPPVLLKIGATCLAILLRFLSAVEVGMFETGYDAEVARHV